MVVRSQKSFGLRPLLVSVALAVLMALLLTVVGRTPLHAQERSGYEYSVQAGDSWPAVARLVGLSVADLQSANPQAMRANGWLHRTEKLFIPTAPGAEGVVHVVQYGESWNGIAIQYGVKARLLQGVNPGLVHPNLVLFRTEQVFIPPAADMAGLSAGPTAPVVAEATTPEAAEPEATAVPSEEAAPESGSEATPEAAPETAPESEAVATATPAPEPEPDALTDPLNQCPDAFAMLPDFVDAVLAAGENDPALLRERLESCGNLDGGVFRVQDVTGDDGDDLVLVYRDAAAQSAAAATDLMVYVGGEEGFVRSYRAKAAGQIELRNTEDINQDGQPDLLWTDTTCGATNCFAAVNVRSWDGAAWVDWTDGTITLANLDAISLADAATLDGVDAQGSVISLKGGVFAGEAAGPQRARTELWASVGGAPYTLAEVTNADSDCLYHVILDANALVLTNTEADLAQARELYADAATDEGLVTCGSRESESDELRSFSLFRLALVTAYLGETETVPPVLDLLSERFPASDYAKLAAFWRTAYEVSGDPAEACRSTTLYAEQNPASWQILDDYGFANPSFAAADVCPVLAGEEVSLTFVPAVGSAAITETGTLTETVSITVSDTVSETVSETVEATAEPAAEPTAQPTEEPAAEPTAEPTEEPTAEPTAEPTEEPTAEPTAEPTEEPAAEPTAEPTEEPAAEPTAEPTEEPVVEPTAAPEEEAAAPAPFLTPAGDEPDCPTNLVDYPDILTTALTTFEGDPLIVETWLLLCDAMAEDRGAVLTEDLNNDQIDDFVIFPVIISDSGLGPGGADGLVLVYYGNPDGSYTLAVPPTFGGMPSPLALADLNEDGKLDLAWTVESCGTTCLTVVEMLSWDGEAYAPGIVPGSALAEGSARLEPVAANSPGQGQQLVLEGGSSGLNRGGLAITHTEVWQSVDGAPYTRLSWLYDRENENSNCLGLRLVEADVAMQAAPLLAYEPAIQLYLETLADDSLQTCSVTGLAEADELALLRGLATFRLTQALSLEGEVATAQGILTNLITEEPESPYRAVTEAWLASYIEDEDAAVACETIMESLEENEELWQITDNFGTNHPVLGPAQICYVPPTAVEEEAASE